MAFAIVKDGRPKGDGPWSDATSHPVRKSSTSCRSSEGRPLTRNQAFLQSGISCIKEPVTSARLLIALFLLGSLCLSVADSLAAADDTSAMEQVIRMVGSLCLSVAD